MSPEDLVVTKVLAGRPKDVEDVRGVIHERKASLDEERIRTVLLLLERALNRSDLLPVFEKVWSEEPPPRTMRRERREAQNGSEWIAVSGRGV